MEKCTDHMINWLIRCKVINKSEKSLYEYALHSFFLLMMPFILAGTIGFCMGMLQHGIVIILPFVILRKFSGGYHAKKLSICIIGSGCLLYLCMMLSKYVKCSWILAAVTVVASLSLILASPIDSESRRLDEDEKKRYKTLTIVCMIFFWLLNSILCLVGKQIYVMDLSIGLLLTAGLQIPCIIKRMINRPKTT